MKHWNFVTVRKDWKCSNRWCRKEIRKGEQCWSFRASTWKNDQITVRHCVECGQMPLGVAIYFSVHDDFKYCKKCCADVQETPCRCYLFTSEELKELALHRASWN